MRSIRETGQNIKYAADAILQRFGVVILIIVAVFAAFSLGRFSVLTNPEAGHTVRISNQYAAAAGDGEEIRIPLGRELVAALGGTVYYFPWCAGAQKIPPEKQRWFVDEEAAKNAGYEPAQNCRGLEKH